MCLFCAAARGAYAQRSTRQSVTLRALGLWLGRTGPALPVRLRRAGDAPGAHRARPGVRLWRAGDAGRLRVSLRGKA